METALENIVSVAEYISPPIKGRSSWSGLVNACGKIMFATLSNLLAHQVQEAV